VAQAFGSVVAPRSAESDWWTTAGLVSGFVAAALAVGVAFAGLYGRAPGWVGLVGSGLHRLHSGHIGDYAAWLVFGAAALVGLLII
jgi:multicomponent Na+:H+ antiporter subunit D